MGENQPSYVRDNRQRIQTRPAADPCLDLILYVVGVVLLQGPGTSSWRKPRAGLASRFAA